MLILLTIALFLLIPCTMLIFKLVRPKFGIQGFMAVLAVLAAWPMVLLARSDTILSITLIVWEPASFFPLSPALLIDKISWTFSLALTTIAFSLIITSIAQLGYSVKPDQMRNKSASANDEQTQITPPTSGYAIVEEPVATNWQSWAGILILVSFGLIAVTAGNLLTLILAWAAIDVIELLILLGQILESDARERVILAFTSRMAGIGMALIAGIIPWSRGTPLTFEAIDQSTSIYLLIAAGLRLGVLPLHLPFIQQLPLRRGLGTALRLVPAAASYILLVRVANVGVLSSATPYLLALVAFAGIFSAYQWMSAKDELNGRPFWLLGSAALAVAASIMNLPLACLAWSIASLLSGNLVLTMPMRHKNLFPVIALGLFNFSSLPFSPTWNGTRLYQYSSSISNTIAPILFYVFSIVYILLQSLLLAGYFRHITRGLLTAQDQPTEHVERWVWLLYPIGLMIVLVGHILVGIFWLPNLSQVSLLAWVIGLVVIMISGGIIYLFMHSFRVFPSFDTPVRTSPLTRLFSLDWFYRLLWNAFRLLARFSSLLSSILEGDGGILWALVLFTLIFVFLQR